MSITSRSTHVNLNIVIHDGNWLQEGYMLATISDIQMPSNFPLLQKPFKDSLLLLSLNTEHDFTLVNMFSR